MFNDVGLDRHVQNTQEPEYQLPLEVAFGASWKILKTMDDIF